MDCIFIIISLKYFHTIADDYPETPCQRSPQIVYLRCPLIYARLWNSLDRIKTNKGNESNRNLGPNPKLPTRSMVNPSIKWMISSDSTGLSVSAAHLESF
jgi:hypothetical protein